jgi:hypothetical protein
LRFSHDFFRSQKHGLTYTVWLLLALDQHGHSASSFKGTQELAQEAIETQKLMQNAHAHGSKSRESLMKPTQRARSYHRFTSHKKAALDASYGSHRYAATLNPFLPPPSTSSCSEATFVSSASYLPFKLTHKENVHLVPKNAVSQKIVQFYKPFLRGGGGRTIPTERSPLVCEVSATDILTN